MNTNIVVALFTEAKPIIEHLGLKESPEHAPFRLFSNKTNALIISGMGKAAMASACGYLHAQRPLPHVWINIGIAGHRSVSIGQPFLANKIVDTSNGQVWYPPQLISTTVKALELHTVNSEENAYPDDVGYDMEAAAFYACASRFSTAELVQCVKVVSDNADSSAAKLDKNKVERLIHDCVDDIIDVITQLDCVASTLPEPVDIDIDAYLTRWHFSHAQQQQLRSLLERLAIVGGVPAQPTEMANSRAVLEHFELQLLRTPIHYA